MLPTHVPLKTLERLIHDHSVLTSSESEEYTPLEMLTGYFEGGEYGGMPIENPESQETDPLKRLQAGERLAIQLHLGMIEEGADFIDGKTYVATQEEIEANDDAFNTDRIFPDESGFFGLGVWLDGDQLGLEPVRISGDFNGNVCVSQATLPCSLLERTASYLKQIT